MPPAVTELYHRSTVSDSTCLTKFIYISYACLGSSLVLGQSLSEFFLCCWMLSKRRRIRETVQPSEYHCRSKRLSKSASITCLGALLMLCHRTLSQSVRRPRYRQYRLFLRVILLCTRVGLGLVYRHVTTKSRDRRHCRGGDLKIERGER